ncbi:MAG: hypothetical protein ABIJ45_05430 [Candidatus Zixiibacteriota bacterium]
MSGATNGAIIAALAAAKKRKEEREEEDKLTKYNGNDMDNWEFKIMRSNWGKFGKTEYLKKVCEEEARSGWELMEKFDNYRVRFKRKIENRSKDQFVQIDPYRTSTELGSGQGVLIGSIVALILGGLLFAIFFAGGNIDFDGFGSGFPVIAIGLLVLLIGLVVAIKKRN